jgi:hypothetical protein
LQIKPVPLTHFPLIELQQSLSQSEFLVHASPMAKPLPPPLHAVPTAPVFPHLPVLVCVVKSKLPLASLNVPPVVHAAA